MDKNTFAWVKTTVAPITPEIMQKEEALVLRLGKKETDEVGRMGRHYESKTDRKHKTPLSAMLGRGRENGTVTECGRFLELWVSAEKMHRGTSNTAAKQVRGRSKEDLIESQESIAARVNHRARKSIRRIVNANGFLGMYTLTLAPPSMDNDKKYDTIPYEKQKDIDYVKKLFKAFVRQARGLDHPLTYLVVFELHDSAKTSPEKRGCWHIHLASDTSKATQQTVKELWTYGLTDFADFRRTPDGELRSDPVENPGAYMAEYIGKEGSQFGAAHLRNKRRYSTSRDALKPVQQALSSVELGGDFDTLEYKGKRYNNVFYSSKLIPNTDKISITATYKEVAR